MVLSIMVPNFPAIGSEGVLPRPPTILMSAIIYITCFIESYFGYCNFMLHVVSKCMNY